MRTAQIGPDLRLRNMELEQQRRRRQRERQKSNRFILAKKKTLHVRHAFLYMS